MKNIYKEWWDRLLFTIEILARWETITYMTSESYEYETSICFSCTKKGVFNVQERHVLEWRRASFCSKLSLSMKREGHENWNILTIPIGMFSILLLQRVRTFSHRKAQMNRTHRGRKIVAPPPSPPPKGRGVITEIPMWGGCVPRSIILLAVL